MPKVNWAGLQNSSLPPWPSTLSRLLFQDTYIISSRNVPHWQGLGWYESSPLLAHNPNFSRKLRIQRWGEINSRFSAGPHHELPMNWSGGHSSPLQANAIFCQCPPPTQCRSGNCLTPITHMRLWVSTETSYLPLTPVHLQTDAFIFL